MPLDYLGDFDSYERDLKDFFGFVECIVSSPKDIEIPLLPYRHEGLTIHPVGTWKGIYFSEELKAVIEHGYKITPLKYYEFSKYNMFNDYINHFYDKKKNSEGPMRFITKMHLNSFYGIFGRRLEQLETIIIHPSEANYYSERYSVYEQIKINS